MGFLQQSRTTTIQTLLKLIGLLAAIYVLAAYIALKFFLSDFVFKTVDELPTRETHRYSVELAKSEVLRKL